MSDRKLHVLGTASQVPTRYRNHNGYFVRWDQEGFLFDPGEGTQRQMTFSGVSVTDFTKIFISHFHGDHCLGLAGLFPRISTDEVPHEIELYFPASGYKYVKNLQFSSIHKNRGKIAFRPIKKEGVVYSDKKIEITALELRHRCPTLGYRIQERDRRSMLPDKLKAAGISGKEISELSKNGILKKGDTVFKVEDFSVVKRGQSFAFVMDTAVCANALALSKDVDLFICESTYQKTEEKEAEERGHMTAEQAAKIAKASDVGRLILTHFSQRYKGGFEEEAREVFENSIAVKDGDVISIR